MRLAIVNDMVMAVEALRRVVATVPEYQVAWVAYDGAEALAKCRNDTPDLILMDLIMPVMDGVAATRRIMQECPCAILIVTATVSGNASKVFEAMGHGALDAVNTPVLGVDGTAQGRDALLSKMATLSRLLGLNPGKRVSRPPGVAATRVASGVQPLVCIGASTGGPHALAKVLGAIPKGFGAPMVVIQHVDIQFADDLAKWLDEQTPLSVRIAPEGGRPEQGIVLLAGTNDHLVLTPQGTLRYTPEPRDYPYRPSVDVFFKSVTAYWGGRSVGVLLTGMGRDGAEGLLSLRTAGHYTIAQDQATSVVYGMPKAAADVRAAVEVLPIERIAAAIAMRVEN